MLFDYRLKTIEDNRKKIRAVISKISQNIRIQTGSICKIMYWTQYRFARRSKEKVTKSKYKTLN